MTPATPQFFDIAVNITAPVYCRESISINAPLKRVWLALTDIEGWSSWNPNITQVSLHGNAAVGDTFSWKTGGSVIRSKLHTVNTGSHFGWSGRAMGIYAVHNWTLTQNNGTITVITEECMSGLPAKLFKGTLKRKTSANLKAWLHYLKAFTER